MQSKLQIIPHAIHFSQETISSGSQSVRTVSSYNTVSPASVYIDGVMHPVIQNNFSTPHQYDIVYNPLDGYLAWHGVPPSDRYSRQTTITINEITSYRVWDRQEFDDWFVTECKQQVFAQQFFGQDSWCLTFVSIDDLTAFRAWWFEPRGVSFRARRDYSMDHDEWKALIAEVYEWIDNAASARSSKNNGTDLLTVEFESENDAIMFKLAWSERLQIKDAK